MAPATVPARPGPPAAGRTLSVKITAEMYDDLVTLMQTGVNASDAVRQAVRQAADIHRTAWAHGVCAPGVTPILDAYSILRQPGYTPPTSGYDAPSDRVGRPMAPPSHPPTGHTTAGGSGT